MAGLRTVDIIGLVMIVLFILILVAIGMALDVKNKSHNIFGKSSNIINFNKVNLSAIAQPNLRPAGISGGGYSGLLQIVGIFAVIGIGIFIYKRMKQDKKENKQI